VEAAATPSARSVRRSSLSLGAAVALTLALVGFAQSDPGQRLLERGGLVAEPERYTELSFTYPSLVPRKLLPDSSPIRVRFTIRNRESSSRIYAWSVGTAGSATPLAAGHVRVAAGERIKVSPKVLPPCDGAKTRVEARIAKPAQKIGFWMECVGAAGA
jgi:hypothetical protein